MARVGRLAVDIGLGIDQHGASPTSLQLPVVDGQQLTRLTEHRWILDDTVVEVDYEYVMEVSFNYGRDRFIHGDFETGTATVVLNNDSGEWTPNSGVNEVGGDKLRPGMIVRILYQISTDQLEKWLEANTAFTWASSGTGESFRSIPNAETFTGFVDGCSWTVHGADSDVTVKPSINPSMGQQYSFGYPRFAGRIWSIEDRYEEGGRGAITVLQLVDYMADLAQINPGALGVPRTAEGANVRMETGIYPSLNDTVVWSDEFQLPNIYTVEASDLPNNYLEEARVAARAAGGAIFAYHSHYGVLTFHNSNWLLTGQAAVVTARIGNDRIGIVNAATDYSLSRVFNNLIYANSTTEVTASDATSIADYSTRTLRRTILNNDATDLAALAARDLAILKDAKLVIKKVTIRPETLFEVAFAMQVECGDLIEVTIVNNGWEYTQQLHVAGISGRWSAATDDWELTLRLDSREGDTVLT